MTVTFKSLVEKFEDKGQSFTTLIFNLPQIPIFDPSCTELQYADRKEMHEDFKRTNKWRFKQYNEKLEELDIWIDHQKHK